jgi:hypothetical protein
MPRTIKAKERWTAAAWVPAVKITKPHADALCEAAGVDPRDRRGRARIVAGVTHAIGLYRAEHELAQTAPRPAHQRAALARLDAAINETLDAINALDDFSREALELPRRVTGGIREGLAVEDVATRLRFWSGSITLALRSLDGKGSRGRARDYSDRALLSLLADVFRDCRDSDDGSPDRAEFLQRGCEAAGFSRTRAQALAAQYDR